MVEKADGLEKRPPWRAQIERIERRRQRRAERKAQPDASIRSPRRNREGSLWLSIEVCMTGQDMAGAWCSR